ncbi:MAG: hypothetical protein RBU25_19950 [Lentisphaeria bacterium]|jgi:hypothetical protein|nr:hypothetical protein [Lentisphaeria bacterium]
MNSKREKILIAFAVLSVLYGAYMLLNGKPAQTPARGGGGGGSGNQTEFVQWLIRVQGQLSTASITPLQREVVARALQPWPDSLILTAALPAELIAAEEARQQAARLAAEAAEQARRHLTGQAERRQQAEQDMRRRFVYSGYAFLEGAGEATLCAVVSGVVYKVGEKLDGSPYLVKSITRDEVVIAATEQDIEVRIPVSP